jgi:hypothetical protein
MLLTAAQLQDSPDGLRPRVILGVGRHYSSCADGWQGTVSLAMTKRERETFLAD